MCGLVGVAGDITPVTARMFSILHHLDCLRGVDGAGFYLNQWDNEGCLAKVEDIPESLPWLYSELYEDKTKTEFPVLRHTDLRLIMGHNRKATTGTVTQANAHPFEFERLVGCHNGGFADYYKNKLLDGESFDVDSEAFYYTLDHIWRKTGKVKWESFKELMNFLYGAFALTFWDREKEILYFYRNKERPLYFAFTKERRQLYWASEKWMLEVAADRCKVTWEKEPFLYQIDHLCSMNITKDKKGVIKVNVLEEKKCVRTFPQSNVVYPQVSHNRPVATPTTTQQKEETSKGTVRFRVCNEVMTEDQFERNLKCGCAWCSSPLFFEDRGKLRFIDSKTAFCPECTTNDVIKEIGMHIDVKMEAGVDVH